MTSIQTLSSQNRRSKHRSVASWFVCYFLLLSLKAANANKPTFTNHLDSIRAKGGLQNRFFALRHGQSEANVQGIIASDPKIATVKYGLSPEGKLQAQRAGKKLVTDFLQARLEATTNQPSGIVIVASDLTRAKETAEALVTAICKHNENASSEDESIPLYIRDEKGVLTKVTAATAQCLTIDTRLRERWFGNWDGKPDKHYKDVWKDDVKDAYHTNNGVESVWSVVDRSSLLVSEYDTICDNNFWIICVAHGDVLQILQTAFCSSMDPKDHRSLEHLETAIMRPLNLN